VKPLSLLGVLVLAKAVVLWGRGLPWSAWAPLAYLWQDLLVVCLYAGVDVAARRRPWASWAVYGLVVAYTAINVPVACLLSTPLTVPMLRAARGALAGSVAYHATWDNLLRVAAVLAAAVVFPLLLRRRWKAAAVRVKVALALALPLLAVLGPAASARVDTLGLHRNPLVALATTALPRVAAAEYAGDWRVSPFGGRRADDLTRFRGAARGRNVVIVHLESTAARYLRPYGAAEDPMPRLTALSREAILFENAYTVYPETVKSFIAVQCAVHPALDTEAEAYEHIRSPSLASELGRAGYRTGLFHSGRFRYLGMAEALRGRAYDALEDAGDIGGRRESSFGIDEGSTVRRMLAWVDAGPPGRPFFLSYLPIAGHHPYDTPEAGPYPEDRPIGRYRNALRYSDESLGQLLGGLRDRGLLDNTLLVILGDHGEAFGQHPGNHGHSIFIYEENVRVPYLIVLPGLVREPVRVRRVASAVDTAQTVLDLLGLPCPWAYRERSLLDPHPALALFFTDYSLGLLGLRDGRWKFIYELESERPKLFDLESDPDERHDLAGEHPERVEAYRDHLLRWSANQKHLITRPR
jgi:phosphoglycerol transferase MdoB-like AlkP superfamily enzyme